VTEPRVLGRREDVLHSVCRVSDLDLAEPFWEDYRAALERLKRAPAEAGIPGPALLQRLLPEGTVNLRGMPIRFVPGSALPGVDYEAHIHDTGEVSTRENNWHDLFNALVWSRFPRLKAAMNAVHFTEMQQDRIGRGPVRDALTLFDECGAIVLSDDIGSLELIAAHEWQEIFQKHARRWGQRLHFFICGHALLEKFIHPYKAIAAHVVLIHMEQTSPGEQREQLLRAIDAYLARTLLAASILRTPGDLAPLPVMGIPGWWARSEQDSSFYANRDVFRPRGPKRQAAPILALE